MKLSYGDLIIIETVDLEPTLHVLNIPVIFLFEERTANDILYYTVLVSKRRQLVSIKNSDKIIVLSAMKDAI